MNSEAGELGVIRSQFFHIALYHKTGIFLLFNIHLSNRIKLKVDISFSLSNFLLQGHFTLITR